MLGSHNLWERGVAESRGLVYALYSFCNDVRTVALVIIATRLCECGESHPRRSEK